MPTESTPITRNGYAKNNQSFTESGDTKSLIGGGEMGGLIRSYDWSKSSIGSIDSWPVSLRISVNIMLHSSFPVFIWWNKDELINFYNDAYIPILGDRHPEALGAPAQELWPEIWSDIGPLTDLVFNKSQSVYQENQKIILNRSIQNEEAFFTYSYTPLFDIETRSVSGLFCTIIETTKEVLAQQNIQESEARFRDLADTAPMFIAMANDKGEAVYFNKPWLDFTGKKLDELKGLGWLSTLHPDDAPVFDRDFKKAFKNKTEISKEYRFKRADGEYRWMLAIGAPRFTPDGHFSGYFGTYTDFHELKQAQLVLEDREERFRKLIELSPSAVQLVSKEGKILYSSDSLKNVLGYEPKDLADEGIMPYLHPEDSSYFFEKFDELLENPEQSVTLQYRVKHKDGTWAWLETVAINHLDTRNINALVGNFRNITLQKKAEDKVNRSEQRFRALADNIPNLAWMAHADGTVYWYNDRWYEYTGMTPASMNDATWKSIHDPKYLPVVLKKWNDSIENGHEFEMVFPLRGADGEYRPFLTRMVPLRSTEGKIEQWIGTNTDISEHLKVKQTEARNQELVALNKAKDEFISLASHQLRTPATGVKQYIGMLLEGYAGDLNDLQQTFAQRANDSNERELMIINDLLNVAQVDAGKMHIKKRSVDLLVFLRSILDEQQSKFDERHQNVSLVTPDTEVIASIDQGRMRMAIENLIDNASKYTPDHREIVVGVRLGDADTICIEVRDQGVGIKPGDRKKIFEKFVRIDNSLSDTISGSGIGLYLVKEIVTLHQGAIRVDSRVGKGTSFIITLPR